MSLPDRINSWNNSIPPETEETADDTADSVTASPYGSLVARLVPAVGSEEALELYERTGVLILGRSRDLPVECRVSGDRVSSRHCEFNVDPVTRKVTLRDISSNGTFLNGQRVGKTETVELQPDDRVSLISDGSQAVFVFQRVSGVTSTAAMAEELTCTVCRCLYLRPCSVLPCMHVFCAACISQWLRDGHTTCIECRGELREVRPTHKIQSFIDRLLRADPSLARSANELTAAAAVDDIPANGRNLKKRRRESDLGSDSDVGEEEDSESPHSSSSDSANDENNGRGINSVRPQFGRLVFGMSHAAVGRCRHCDGASLIDGFQCPPGAPHLTCDDCRHFFPQRPLCDRPQRCQLCSAPRCNLYYAAEGGCPAVFSLAYTAQPLGNNINNNTNNNNNNNNNAMRNTRGMAKLKEHVPCAALPHATFGGNSVEQGILTRYFASQQINIVEVWNECLQKMESGEWVPDVACVSGQLTVNSALCYACMETVFANLLFHYRRAIPSERLPDEVNTRANCWYGINCRTQFHKPHHANNFNHVCYDEKRKE